ncbi:MAG: hypothetical protein IT270_06450 [Saprospiraceae bacterium]|nr:hypothetical protein [Saprospiraceae bacterium]
MNPLLRILLMGWLLAVVSSSEMVGQCPVIQSCPAAQLTICDYSTNDSMLWHDDPFTWSPVLLSSDIYESAANLSIMFGDTCGGMPEVSYTVFFDLEQDNLNETVISSNMDFPPGKMLYGNAFSPGYLEGDTMTFDSRNLPDSMRYNFALEVEAIGNSYVAVLRWNTLTSPFQYAQARLPEGRHHIVWKVVSGGVTKTCEYNFRVRDCLEPEAYCLPPSTINIQYDQIAELPLSLVRDYGMDNISPDDELSYSMRRAGTGGSGYPLDSFGISIVKLPFACSDTGSHIVEMWVQDLHGNAGFCQTTVTVTDTSGYCFVLPNACARAAFGTMDTLESIVFEITAGDSMPLYSSTLQPLDGGCAEVNLSTIPAGATYVLVKPYKSDTPLNGVSTFDLVLISKHILDVELFSNPWQYVAADINYSNTVTTFDIAQIRKLILGLVDTLPQNVTWRFISADCVLPPLPLPLPCVNSVAFNFPPTIYPDFNFLGIKLGDVNGSALINSLSADATPRSKARLVVPNLSADAGQFLDVPFYLDAPGDRLGLQLALDFNPELFEITGLSAPNLPDFDGTCWAQNGDGRLAISWSVPLPHALLPDAPAFTVHLRARKATNLSEAVQLDVQRLNPETYAANGDLQDLELTFGEAYKDLSVKPQPNPGAGGAQWPLRLNQPGKVQLQLVDARGQIRYQQNETLSAGAHWLTMPHDPSLAPGLYSWRIQSADGIWTGQWVKI